MVKIEDNNIAWSVGSDLQVETEHHITPSYYRVWSMKLQCLYQPECCYKCRISGSIRHSELGFL